MFILSIEIILFKYLETSITIPGPTHCPANEVPAARGIIDKFSFKQKEIIFSISELVFGKATAIGYFL